MLETFFILFILLFSNYMTTSFGSSKPGGKFNNYITGNAYVLNFIMLFVIYFSVKGFHSKEKNLYTKLKDTLFIWVIYLLIIKINKKLIFILFILFFLLYILHEYKEHNFHHDKHPLLDEYLDRFININKVVIGIILFYGLLSTSFRPKTLKDLLSPL